MMIYETRNEADKNARGNATLQVDGGYAVVEWSEYFRRITEEADDLYASGWGSEDEEELKMVYGFDDEHAIAITDILHEFETE